MNVHAENIVKKIKQDYNIDVTGVSPYYGNRHIPKTSKRIIAKDFGNGIGHIIYVDHQNRLIGDYVQKIVLDN